MPSAAALRLTIERSLERRFPAALTPAPRTLRETAATGIAEVDVQFEGGMSPHEQGPVRGDPGLPPHGRRPVRGDPGGLPIGAISELTGPVSSGRTSLALAFVARRTAEGRACAWVDANDAFDPECAAASGVILPQLLWVRCEASHPFREEAAKRTGQPPPQTGKVRTAKAGVWTRPDWTRLDQALRAADLLLQAGGFAAIVLDLGSTAREQGNRIPLATWFRFRQAADRTRCSLVVLGRAAYAQSAAEVVLECRPACAVTAGETALRGFRFQIERRRERFAPLVISQKKSPASTWTAGAAWDIERGEEKRA